MSAIASLKTAVILWVWRQIPDCREVSREASRSLERPPGLKRRFQLWLHRLICVWCRRYNRQIRFQHRAASHSSEIDTLPTSHVLSPESKRRITARLLQS